MISQFFFTFLFAIHSSIGSIPLHFTQNMLTPIKEEMEQLTDNTEQKNIDELKLILTKIQSEENIDSEDAENILEQIREETIIELMRAREQFIAQVDNLYDAQKETIEFELMAAEQLLLTTRTEIEKKNFEACFLLLTQAQEKITLAIHTLENTH